MSRLSIVDYRTMNKLLLKLGFVAVRQKGSHVSFVIPMDVQQQFQTIGAAI